MKKIPLRTCVVTKEKLEKKDLIRIVRTPDKEIKIDITGKLNGRGAYIKKDENVLEIAKNKKILSHTLECEIPESIYDELKEMMSK